MRQSMQSGNDRRSFFSKVARLRENQTTLGNSVSCSGIGVHSGREVRMTLAPALSGSGIQFYRTDIPGATSVAARYDTVSGTQLGTTLENAEGVRVATVEHLMAAFAALGVDNARVELDGPEVPIMDGSSAPFVFLIECAGVRALSQPRELLRVRETVHVEDGDKSATLSPYDGFHIDLEIEFESAAVRRQRFKLDISEASFKAQLSRARTFGFLKEVELLRGLGFAQGGSLDNCVVIDGDIVLNEDGLRFGDEFVRHKILDVVGDLALAGRPMLGSFTGVCSGHHLNNVVLRALMARPSAFEIIRLGREADVRKPVRRRVPAAAAAGLAATA